VILFVFALASSVLGVQWRSILPGAENAKGVVGGVKAAVYTFMSYIFYEKRYVENLAFV